MVFFGMEEAAMRVEAACTAPPPSIICLPPELLMRILTQVAGPNAALLLACSSTCKHFRSCCNQVLATMKQAHFTRYSLQRFEGKEGEVVAALLARMPSLRLLDLSGANPWVHDAMLECLVSLEHLSILKLDHCERVTEAGLEHLTRLPHLQVLSISSCKGIGPGCPLERMAALEELHACWCWSLCERVFVRLASRLRVLIAHGCHNLTDSSCSHLEKCEVLDAAFTRISDVGLITLSEYALRLQELRLACPIDNLWHTGNWTPIGKQELQRRRPDVILRELFV